MALLDRQLLVLVQALSSAAARTVRTAARTPRVIADLAGASLRRIVICFSLLFV
jgi:hypothetical protein